MRMVYVIGIQRASRNAGTINIATAMASAGLAVANRTSVASSMINESNIVLIAVWTRAGSGPFYCRPLPGR